MDIIFSPPRSICDFIQLETLIFDNIYSKYLYNILKHLIHLPKLHSLILSPINYIQNSSLLFLHIFRLPKLKYCKITYRIKDARGLLIQFNEYHQSSIEYLIINSRFRYESLKNLLICLPKLRHLSINYLFASNYYSEMEFNPIVLKDLKHISFKLGPLHFSEFQMLIKNFFKYVEVLRISTFNESSYSSAEKWKELISSSMPNLRVFDIKNSYSDEPMIHFILVQFLNFDPSFGLKNNGFLHMKVNR